MTHQNARFSGKLQKSLTVENNAIITCLCEHKIEMEPVWKLKLDSDEVIMADDTTRDLSSLMSKIKQTAEFQKQHSNTSNIEDNNDVSSTKGFILEGYRYMI